MSVGQAERLGFPVGRGLAGQNCASVEAVEGDDGVQAPTGQRTDGTSPPLRHGMRQRAGFGLPSSQLE
jgi:hypothetical protein